MSPRIPFSEMYFLNSRSSSARPGWGKESLNFCTLLCKQKSCDNAKLIFTLMTLTRQFSHVFLVRRSLRSLAITKPTTCRCTFGSKHVMQKIACMPDIASVLQLNEHCTSQLDVGPPVQLLIRELITKESETNHSPIGCFYVTKFLPDHATFSVLPSFKKFQES